MPSIVALLIAVTGLVRLWLELRQRACLARQRLERPPEWSDEMSMRRAIDGALKRTRIAVLGIIAETSAALFLATYGIEALARSPLLASAPAALAAVAVASLILLIMGTIRRVVEGANVFGVDASMGRGRPPILLFLRDSFARLLASSIVILPLLVAAAMLMENQAPMWWLTTWAVWLGLLVLELWMRPLIQTRLLYTAAPMTDGLLSARISHLLRRCGLRLTRIEILDASRRTRRANASVHGLGRWKHIYLHDTLLECLGPDEIVAVVAHEAGHARRRHVLQMLGAQAVLGLSGAIGFSIVVFDLEGSMAERLGIIALLVAPAAFLLRPLLLWMSRRFELEADAFAAAHVGSVPMIRALERLYAVNAGVAAADGLYAAFHASHPIARERLGHLRSIPGCPASLLMPASNSSQGIDARPDLSQPSSR